MSGSEDKCLFCYQITNCQPFGLQFQNKDALKLKIDKISSAVCTILNLPHDPYDKIIKSSVICPVCIGLLKGVEKILSDLDLIQKKVIEKRSILEANLINSAGKYDGQDLDRGSITSKNRRKIVEKIKSWDNLDLLDTSELQLASGTANFNDLTVFDDVEGILNLDSVKKEQDNSDLNEWEPADIEDHFINTSPITSDQVQDPYQSQNPTENRNESLVKPSHVVLLPLDLPLEYLKATFDINEDYIQSYIRQDSKIVSQAIKFRQFKPPINEDYQEQEDNGSDSSDDSDFSSDDELSCTKCNYTARTEHGLKLHMARLHKRRGKNRNLKNNLKKVLQNDIYDESSNFIKQSRVKEINDQEEIINCDDCQDYSTLNLVDFHLHKLKEHSKTQQDYFTCPICKKKIKMRVKFRDHLQLHNAKKPFHCHCGLSFKLQRYLKDHELNQGHRKKKKNNEENTEDEESEHVKEKRKSRYRFKRSTPADDVIRKTFYSSLNNHDEIIEDENLEFICTENCGFKENNVLEYYSHMLYIHSIREGFKCPIEECGASIKMGQKFKQHLQIHKIKNKPFNCTMCDGKFATISYLQSHMTRGHGISMRRPGSGSIELNQGQRKNAKEINVDQDDESDPVNVTEKRKSRYRFIRSTPADDLFRKTFYSSLNNHDEIIEDENLEFICTENCGFKENNVLEYYSHMLYVHSIREGFKCPIEECGANIKMGQKFKQHLQIHKTKNKPFQCTIEGCVAKFAIIDYLQSHMTRGHGISMSRPGSNELNQIQGHRKNENNAEETNDKNKLGTEKIKNRFSDYKFKYKLSRATPADDESREAFYSNLKNHAEVIEDENLEFICTENCGFKDNNVLEYYSHITNTHGIREGFKCPIEECGTIIKMGQKFKQHLKIHKIKNKPFACAMEGCDAKFAVIGYLHDHMIRTHGISMRRPGLFKKNFKKNEKNADEIDEDENYDRDTEKRNNHYGTEELEKKLRDRYTPADDEFRKTFYSNLNNHEEAIEDENLEFICTENCGFKDNNALEYYSHILNIHGIREGFKCPIVECGSILKMRQKFKRHLKIHKIKNKPFACTMEGCDAKFAIIDYLQTHMIRGHGISVRRPGPGSRNKIIRKSSTEKIFCEVCGKLFFSRSNYNDHYSKMHDDSTDSKTHFCEICGKVFSTLKYLTSHQRYHGIGKPLLCCEHCEFKTINNVSLKIHINTIHLGKKDFICDMCPQTFSRRTNLMEHIKCKHEEHKSKDFECDVCFKKFYLKSRLRSHKSDIHRSQSKSKPFNIIKFSCPEKGCKEEYTRNRALKRHIAKIHTKNLNFPCPHCDQRFFQQYNLKRHLMNKHKYDKPNKCEICGRGFTIKHYLKRHMLQNHADDSEKLFKCLPCGKHYGTKESLYFHNKFHHPEVLTQSSTT